MLRDTIRDLIDHLEAARLEAKERADAGSYEIAWAILNAALEGLVAETRMRLEPKPRE